MKAIYKLSTDDGATVGTCIQLRMTHQQQPWQVLWNSWAVVNVVMYIYIYRCGFNVVSLHVAMHIITNGLNNTENKEDQKT